MEKVLVINCGSTSTKYKLFNVDGEENRQENFGIIKSELDKENNFLKNIYSDIVENKKEKIKIAFRVVHGGDLIGPIKINKKVKSKIEEFLDFAPIHNSLVLNKIKQMEEIFPIKNKKINFYAVFDTDFHQTIPEKNRLYAIDRKISEKYKIKKYGFHGIAVESAIQNLKEKYKKDKKKFPKRIIVAHLGGGSSLTAVLNGKSIANTMGLTPISGLVMTTRVGEVDSDLDIILAKRMNKKINDISNILSFKSGLFGLAGTKDIKYIFDMAKTEKKDKKGKYKREELAFDIYFEKLVEKIFGYIGKMNGIDKIIFSGGIGYGNSFLREELLKKLKIFGISKKDFYITKVNEEKIIYSKVRKKLGL